MSWAAVTSAVVVAGASAGIAAASAPNFPDAQKSSRRTVLAALNALPEQKKIDAAAKLGQSVEFNFGKKKPVYEEMPIEEARNSGKISQVEYAKLLQDGKTTVSVQTGWKQGTKTADFTGWGDADIQGELQRQLAEVELDLQKKYGKDFIAEALKQQALADPEGTEARGMLADQINSMADRERKRPVATALDSQIFDEVKRGRELDDDSLAAIAETLKRRGDTTIQTGDVEHKLEAGPEADARLRARLGKAMGYYGSGVTPTDVNYRDKQQTLANMASFLNGRTPQSQFSSLAGGQQGAAPQPQAAPTVGLPGNLTGVAQGGAVGQYQAGVKAAANSVSPWFAGLSAAASAFKNTNGFGMKEP